MSKHDTHLPVRIVKSVICFLLIAFTVLILLAGTAKSIIETTVYPRKYREEVETAAAEYGVEPNLLYAIIKAESKFKQDAVSRSGAIGLMQMLPDTFLLDVRDKIGYENAGSDILFQADVNILAGTYYFAHLYDYFHTVYQMKDPIPEAIAAYNGGIGNVKKWLDDDTLSDWKGLFLDEIPFRETGLYVKRVLKYKDRYDSIYGPDAMADGYISEALAYRYACRYGKMYDMDPRFIMAVVRAETDFDTKDVSPSGAMGLMQIMRGTYGDIQSDLQLTRPFEDLTDPAFNMQCGTYYLHWIDTRIVGYAEIAASYNAGLSTVQEWLQNEQYATDGKTLIWDAIPAEQTRNYVKNVMRYYDEYKIRYPDVP